jgi:hypothetical protein
VGVIIDPVERCIEVDADGVLQRGYVGDYLITHPIGTRWIEKKDLFKGTYQSNELSYHPVPVLEKSEYNPGDRFKLKDSDIELIESELDRLNAIDEAIEVMTVRKHQRKKDIMAWLAKQYPALAGYDFNLMQGEYIEVVKKKEPKEE